MEQRYHDDPRPAVWTLYETGCGARWASVTEREHDGTKCFFSGCPTPNDSSDLTRRVKETFSRDEASDWFRRPTVSK